MKARLWLIAVIVLLLAAVVFAVAMTGHTFVAALCAFIALVIVFFHFAKRRWLRVTAAVVLVIGAAVFSIIEVPIVADARTETMTEGEAMATWLEAKGIAPDRIIVEDRATSTQENLEFSFELIRERGGDPDGNTAIVTSEYHLYRAKALAEKQGVECFGVAARTSWPTLMLNYFIREGFAVTYYRLTGEI